VILFKYSWYKTANYVIVKWSIGADYSFRQKEFNRLFSKSVIRVTYTFLIAKTIETVKAGFAQLANAFRTPAFATI